MKTMSAITLASTIVQSSNQVSTDLGNEKVILGLASEEYYSLKEVGARIWERIQEPTTVQEIREAILASYAVEPEQCERDLLAVLQDMANEGLVEIRQE
jgi:hypothetical protein